MTADKMVRNIRDLICSNGAEEIRESLLLLKCSLPSLLKH